MARLAIGVNTELKRLAGRDVAVEKVKGARGGW